MAMKVNKKKNKKPIRAAEEYLCFSSIPLSISVLCSTKQSQYSLLVSNLKLGGSLYMSQTRFVTFLLWSAVQFVFLRRDFEAGISMKAVLAAVCQNSAHCQPVSRFTLFF